MKYKQTLDEHLELFRFDFIKRFKKFVEDNGITLDAEYTHDHFNMIINYFSINDFEVAANTLKLVDLKAITEEEAKRKEI